MHQPSLGAPLLRSTGKHQKLFQRLIQKYWIKRPVLQETGIEKNLKAEGNRATDEEGEEKGGFYIWDAISERTLPVSDDKSVMAARASVNGNCRVSSPTQDSGCCSLRRQIDGPYLHDFDKWFSVSSSASHDKQIPVRTDSCAFDRNAISRRFTNFDDGSIHGLCTQPFVLTGLYKRYISAALRLSFLTVTNRSSQCCTVTK